MAEYKIVPCRKEHIPGIINVCYRTGRDGEDLAGTGIFNDRYLFALRYALYYAKYESVHCFAAVDDNGRVIGYILGTPDTISQKSRIRKKMGWRIRTRALLVSIWRYPESFRRAGALLRSLGSIHLEPSLLKEYPAHLHINVLPGLQRGGVGTLLLHAFEAHMKELEVPGIHLGTSSLNAKAIPFYQKHGYRILSREPIPGREGVEKLVFAKSFI